MSKCKFKVGDRVRVKRDLIVGKTYDGITLLNGMNEDYETILTIRVVDVDNCMCSNGYYYGYGMLELVCKFKVGDYVICNTNCFATVKKGWVGRVTCVMGNDWVRVENSNWIIQGEPKDFDLYTKDQPTKIVITTDGKTTTAKMYRDKTVVGVETTKCHPEDRFDFMVGARVAFDRLVGEKKEEPEKPKYYNGKVVCVDTRYTTIGLTKGKIYTFIDGAAPNDDGGQVTTKVVDFNDLVSRFSSVEWLEVVE